MLSNNSQQFGSKNPIFTTTAYLNKYNQIHLKKELNNIKFWAATLKYYNNNI